MKRIGIFSIGMIVAFLSASIHLSAQGEKKKSAIKIGLSYIKVNDQAPVLKASAQIKNGKKFEPLEGVEINLSFMEETPRGFLGRVKTNNQGTASMTLPAEINTRLDSLSPFKFIASVTSTDRFDEQTAEIEITRARIELSLPEADSVKKVEAKVLELKDGKWIAVPQTEVKLFVKRLFADFSIGENAYTTNEAGEVSAEFKMSIPGDASGNIIIGSKIDESDVYGTISTTKVMKWGVPQKEDNSFYERSLWAARDKTPWWLLIFPNVIIAAVWGFIFYIVYLLRRIRKIGMAN